VEQSGMTIERVDRQTAPLVEGRFYLVPTVEAKWCGKLAVWPVIGPLHEDREIFRFEFDHYHVDARFLPRRFRHPERTFSHPLHRPWPIDEATALPSPVLRRRLCVRAHLGFEIPWGVNPAPWKELCRAFAGHQCASGKGGWICPHRKASLGSILPVDGVITCPLHGLRIDAASGKVISSTAMARP
jgi:hypothetical protein